jgi:hypothetical protein
MDLSVACNLELGFPFPPVVSFPATPFPDLLSPENSYQRLSVSSATIMISTLLTMPSKKKGPRKKAKADKKHEDKKAVTVVAINSQMQRLKIDKAVLDDDDAFLEEAIQLAAAEEEELKALEKCRHGYSPRSSREHNYCDMFSDTFVEEFCCCHYLDPVRGTGNIFHKVMAVTEKIFPGVWWNEKKLELFILFCLSQGAEYILKGAIDMARCDAVTANLLEPWIDVMLRRTKAEVLVGAKLYELFSADEHTLLVSYFRKRISCSCLDQKYAKVKSIKKMGQCFNPTCSHPDGKVERSTMLSCTRCRGANYCSQECQTQHWKFHKKDCDDVVATRAAFDSKRD